jgi:hypothetical protein
MSHRERGLMPGLTNEVGGRIKEARDAMSTGATRLRHSTAGLKPTRSLPGATRRTSMIGSEP